ncbi:MAG: hypothetical protein AAFY71_00190 [Bacteroidota bacterium]
MEKLSLKCIVAVFITLNFCSVACNYEDFDSEKLETESTSFRIEELESVDKVFLNFSLYTLNKKGAQNKRRCMFKLPLLEFGKDIDSKGFKIPLMYCDTFTNKKSIFILKSERQGLNDLRVRVLFVPILDRLKTKKRDNIRRVNNWIGKSDCGFSNLKKLNPKFFRTLSFRVNFESTSDSLIVSTIDENNYQFFEDIYDYPEIVGDYAGKKFKVSMEFEKVFARSPSNE